MLLKKKVVVITGCNKGIGKKILEKFSENGAIIYACVRNVNEEFQKEIKNLENKYHNKIEIIPLDLSDEKKTLDAADNIINKKNKINVLVNNAGVISTSLFQMTKIDEFKKNFQINFFSQTLFTQKILRFMEKESSIIFISSSSATDSNIGRSAYSSSKASINSLSKSLSKELGALKIRVNTIEPGLTDTDMMRNNTSKDTIEMMIKQNISLKRIGSPEEIANVALFLASDLSSYVTGQVIRADGGLS
tara:strand:- start:3729 stop:4472 length:744 start_codon:yes stop_codon:yes gene_type:complete